MIKLAAAANPPRLNLSQAFKLSKFSLKYGKSAAPDSQSPLRPFRFFCLLNLYLLERSIGSAHFAGRQDLMRSNGRDECRLLIRSLN